MLRDIKRDENFARVPDCAIRKKISLKHYLKLVIKGVAEEFWNISPEEKLKAAA